MNNDNLTYLLIELHSKMIWIICEYDLMYIICKEKKSVNALSRRRKIAIVISCKVCLKHEIDEYFFEVEDI